MIPIAPQPRRWLPFFSIVRCHDCQGLPHSSCANDKHGQASRSRLVYQFEHVVIGPVNHSCSMKVADQRLCSNRVSGHLCSCSCCGSRKGTAVRWWFTEPPINKFEGLTALAKALVGGVKCWARLLAEVRSNRKEDRLSAWPRCNWNK